jgi:hypothetical protein
MNYPVSLINQRNRKEPSPKKYDLNDLSYVHQKRPPTASTSALYRPFSNTSTGINPIKEDKLGNPPVGFKNSTLTFTTTPNLNKTIIVIFFELLSYSRKQK